MAKVLGADGTPVDVPTRGKPVDPGRDVPVAGGLRITPDISEADTDISDVETVGESVDADRPARRPLIDSDGEHPTIPGGRAHRKSRADPPTVYGGAALRGHQPAENAGHPLRSHADSTKSRGPAARPRSHRQIVPGELPTAWLVIVDGPGRGATLQLGMGPHKIGRGKDMRLRLDFGDEEVSRDTHAIVTYDPRGNSFFVHSGNNLVYLRGDGDEIEPVLTPLRLNARSEIVVGQTRMRFVMLCDESFTWQ